MFLEQYLFEDYYVRGGGRREVRQYVVTDVRTSVRNILL
jgi:hypothetical protein